MKFHKVIALLLLPFLIEGISSCCQCADSVIKKYTNKNLSLVNLDNTGVIPFETNSDSIKKTAYGIRLKLEREEYVRTQVTSLFSSACAYSCRCPPATVYRPQDSILSFQIITINDFDSTHKAGADIAPYFHIYENHKFLTTLEFLEKYNTSFNLQREFSLSIDFLLMNVPVLGLSHQFKLVLNLSDGRILEVNTKMTALY